MANPFVHCELATTDLAKAKSFYGKLFGWKLEDMPMDDGTYTMIDVGEGTGGGMLKHPMPGAPSMWMPYVLVDDIKAATAQGARPRRQRREGRDGGEGDGVAVDLRRSHGRDPRVVAGEVAGSRYFGAAGG